MLATILLLTIRGGKEMKKDKLKKEYFNIFKSNLLLLETVSDNVERLLEDFDKTFEYMQNTDNDLQEYLKLLNDEKAALTTILLEYSAIVYGKKNYFVEQD